MPTRDDEPLPAGPTELEEISSDFIIQDEATEPELPAPVHADDPFVAASRALVDESARTGEIARRAAVPAARAATREPERQPVESPKGHAAPFTPTPPEPGARRQGFPLVAALVFLLVGAGAGFFAGMLWERQGRGAKPTVTALPSPPESTPANAPEPPKAAAKAAPKAAKGTKTAAKSRTAAKTLTGKGRLDLTAPDNAEVYLDGRRIGRGSMHLDVAPGAHRIEVRLGKARVSERFEVAPNETWTYDVTPTK